MLSKYIKKLSIWFFRKAYGLKKIKTNEEEIKNEI